ncbi:LysR substrate-binding domain-containing protein [Variovorax sp. LjRoot290]|uniref:LysR substrate-binding domain-containing protein n=1 Tax=Variovorax sp. LjRoot290 TaxID=3342316 RepID=UPI003ECEC53D
MRCVLEAARQDVGLAFVFRQFAEEAIRRGELLALLDRHCAPADTFNLYYPHRAPMPGKPRTFIDFMQEKNRKRQTSRPTARAERRAAAVPRQKGHVTLFSRSPR